MEEKIAELYNELLKSTEWQIYYPKNPWDRDEMALLSALYNYLY